MMTQPRHPDELTLLRLSELELAGERAEHTRRHLIECMRCRSSYEALKAETELLRAALKEQEDVLPESIRPRSDLSWIVVAAIALGTLGVSTFWTRYIEPMLQGMDSVGVDGTSLFTAIVIRGALWRGWSGMAMTLVQGVLILAIVATTTVILHWGWRRFRTSTISLAIGIAVALGLGTSDTAVGAVIVHDEGTYTLSANEVVDNDLIVAAERVRIDGMVAGDLIFVGRLIEVSGEVQGDVLGFAEHIEITGRVGGSVRTGSRSLDVSGQIGRNVTSVGETIEVGMGGGITGSLTTAARKVSVMGPVNRDVITAAESQRIDAAVGGSGLMAGGRLVVGPGGGFGAEATFYGAEEPEVDSEAMLASPIQFEHVETDDDHGSGLSRALHFVYFWAAAFVLGAAIMLLTPEASEVVITEYMPIYGKNILVGVLSGSVVLALSVLLMVTMVGLPLGLVTLFVWMLGTYVAQAYVGAFIGREILGTPTELSRAMARVALGLFLIHLVKQIPFVGQAITLLVALWGFGALTLWTLANVPKSSSSHPVPPAPEPAESSVS